MNFGKLAMTPRARVKITDNAFCALVRPDLACNGICVRETIEFGIVRTSVYKKWAVVLKIDEFAYTTVY